MDSLAKARDLLLSELNQTGFDFNTPMSVRPLDAVESVGSASSPDLALRRGPEKLIQADIGDTIGQAFTDDPRTWQGTVKEVFELPLDRSSYRAFNVAAINALMRKMKRCTGTVHCRDLDPEKCGGEVADMLASRFGKPKIAMFGFQPFMVKALVERFGTEAVEIADLNPANIGTQKFGLTIKSGETDARAMIESCSIGFVTGSSIVNGTLDGLRELFIAAGKPVILFGNTVSGVGTLLDYDRFCPFGS